MVFGNCDQETIESFIFTMKRTNMCYSIISVKNGCVKSFV